jgi:hypothetical protein
MVDKTLAVVVTEASVQRAAGRPLESLGTRPQRALEIETETLASAQEGKLGVTWRRSPQRE